VIGTPFRRAARGLAFLLVLTACPGGEEAQPTPTSPSPERTSTPTPAPSPQERFEPNRVRLDLRRVGRGFEAPLLVTHAGDGTGRLFVVEQFGRIRLLRDGSPQRDPFLDVSSLVSAGGERGLLGLAFHPDYETNGRFFVNYTDSSGDTVIVEYRVSRDPAHAAPGSARVILREDQPYANHNGGNLVFGPDGYLYIGMGDGGSGGDPHGNGQRTDTLLGKMLRIDVDGAGPYRIPPDNPFVGDRQGRAEIWGTGLRNPWRFSFDRETGDLWIGDVGQDQVEEVNRTRAGRGGSNYGWNVMEGTQCYSPSEGCDPKGLVHPIAVYPTSLGCAVVGGYVYRGSRFPALRGGYFFADYCAGVMFAIDSEARSRQEPVTLLQTGHPISSFGEDEGGELYVTDLASGDILQVTGERR
jgi:glucose/arabinose dehydrogenase